MKLLLSYIVALLTSHVFAQEPNTGHIIDTLLGIEFDVPEGYQVWKPYDPYQFIRSDHSAWDILLMRQRKEYTGRIWDEIVIEPDMREDRLYNEVQQLDSITYSAVTYDIEYDTLRMYSFIRIFSTEEIIVTTGWSNIPSDPKDEVIALLFEILNSTTINGPDKRSLKNDKER